jgi:uncharacterized membrane protein YraQ (UPF0718 family)
VDWEAEWKPLTIIVIGFLICFYLPVGNPRFNQALLEALYLVKWYTREHVILCLIPAFFIAGAISVFISQASVLKYLGVKANKALAYGVASVSGTVLAVCSCTVLPLFAGLYQRGAGLGPATAFLYSGPAINVLAIILTARVLGIELGIARGLGAIIFSVVIGLIMQTVFRKEETEKTNQINIPETAASRPLWKNAIYFALLVGILVFANWGNPLDPAGFWATVYSLKWKITGILAIGLGILLSLWFNLKIRKMISVAILVGVIAILFPHHPIIPFVVGIVGLSAIISTDKSELGEWFFSSWGFAKQILPLLLIGVLIAGMLLGRPGVEGLIPSLWVSKLVGGNSLEANLFASVVGAFMYFATLTEVPIVQGLLGSGMGKGPALALLLAGPALSLPNMLVLRSIMGTKKTFIYVTLVCVMATITGMIYGKFFG